MFVQRRRRAPGWHAAVHDYSRTPASTRSADKPWQELPYTPVYISGEANRIVPVLRIPGPIQVPAEADGLPPQIRFR